jgi:hypothetical protein
MSTLSNRLYDHFQRERSAFGRSLLAVISIGVFYALVFQPYLSTLANLVEMDNELTRQAGQIAAVQNDIQTATNGITRADEFMGDASAYHALYEEADTWVDNVDSIERLYDRQSRKLESLRSSLEPDDQAAWQPGREPPARIIGALRVARPQIMADHDMSDNCFFHIEADWVHCMIDQELAPIHQRLSRVLYDRSESYEYTEKLATAIRANREKYEEGFPAALGQATLEQWVRDYLDEESKIIRSWYEEVARERLQLMKEASQQQKLLAQNKEQRAGLENRKQEISQSGKLDTPVGALPLAFLDMLTLLPLVLLVTGTMLLRSQSRLLELRHNFNNHGPDEETGSEALRLTMPIWLNDGRGRMAGWFALLVLLAPGIAAFLGIVQLVTNPGLNISNLQLNLTIGGTLAAAAIYAFHYFSLYKARQGNRV